MAKFGVLYNLCSIIDSKSVLGVTKGSDETSIIVTFQKNIVIQYRVVDRKQLKSWCTKQKITSPVYSNEDTNNYVALINHKFIKEWNDNVDNLDSVKKRQKFDVELFTLLKCDKDFFLIYTSGKISHYKYGLVKDEYLDVQKKFNSSEVIKDVIHLTINANTCIGLITCDKNLDQEYFSWIWLNDKMHVENNGRILIMKTDVSLRGYCLKENESGGISFIMLWSNRQLESIHLNNYTVCENLMDNTSLRELGELCAINCSEQSVVMRALNKDYIAIYGADMRKDGSLLCLFNVNFCTIQARQEFKIYSKGGGIWLQDNCIYLTVGRNLNCIPYWLHSEQMAALVGTQRITIEDANDDIEIVHTVEVADWRNPDRLNDAITTIDHSESGHETQQPNTIKHTDAERFITTYINQGWSESAICQEIIPKLIDDNNSRGIFDLLNYVKSLPETVVGKLLSFFLSNDLNENVLFKFQRNDAKSMDITYELLLNMVLSFDYTASILTGYLRANLSFDNGLKLIEYLDKNYLRTNSQFHEKINHYLPSLSMELKYFTQCAALDELKTTEWCLILLDTYFPYMLLSSNKQHNMNILKNLRDAVDEKLNSLKDIQSLAESISKLDQFRKYHNQRKLLLYKIRTFDLY